jgi:hypothetical protein
LPLLEGLLFFRFAGLRFDDLGGMALVIVQIPFP